MTFKSEAQRKAVMAKLQGKTLTVKREFFVWWREGDEPSVGSTAVNLQPGNTLKITGTRGGWMEAALQHPLHLSDGKMHAVTRTGARVLLHSDEIDNLRAGKK